MLSHLAIGQELNIKGNIIDSLSQVQDSIPPLVAPPLLADSVPESMDAQDSVRAPREDDIETTVFYKANDSINFNVKTQIVKMYGDAKVTYGQIELEAEEITINWETQILDANGVRDSTGKLIGKPVFKDGPESYVTNEIKYNFDTRKAIISGVVTQQGEAFMHGERIKKNEKDELYLDHAKYTTCNLEDPHFHISASKIKLIPNDKILTGPFNLQINNIPTPVFFGFGMFPMPDKRTSGIIFPTYGEERRRGFFLRDGGYYFSFSEYVDLSVTGEVYSKGSAGVRVASVYKKRYSHDGRLNIQFNRQRLGELETDSTISNDFWVQWSHTPQSKGTGRFTASVNAGTTSFNNNNPSTDMQRQVNQNFTSNVSYANVIQGTPFNYTISARQNQNLRTGQIDFLLPEFSLNMNRIYPLKPRNGSAKTWWQKINFSYTSTATNRVTNNLGRLTSEATQDSITEFSLENIPFLLRRAQNGVRHVIPVSTSFNILKFLTVSPSFNYEELWYFRQLNHSYDEELGRVAIDTLDGFSRAYSYNANVGVTTRLYGTKYFNSEVLKAVRHVIVPTVGFSYRPDFSDPRYGIYNDVQINEAGDTRLYSKFEQFVYGSPGAGRSGNISFSLQNNLEAKIRSKKDTTGTDKKIVLIDNLGFSSSYNMLADSFKLQPIRTNLRTRVFNNKVDINIQASFDPYVVLLDSITYAANGRETVYQRRTNTFNWDAGKGLGRLTSINVSSSASLNPKSKGGGSQQSTTTNFQNNLAGGMAGGLGSNIQNEEGMDDLEDQMAYIAANPNEYVDWSVPWNLRVGYNIIYNRNGFEEANITQTANFSGDVSLSENWKIGFTSGYDLTRKDFTLTSLNIYRDLHCWQMNVAWTPFGRFQSFSVDLQVKASILQDLKLSRRRSWWDF